MFDPAHRDRALAALPGPFDLVVVGGGINGAGILLDASQRGLSVLLVEREDLAAGTSSRSSKLIHGGLRYLKQMQVRTTRLSVRERDRQLALSPHLVERLPWVYPAYHGDPTPGWTVEMGLWLYDRMARGPERHGQLDGDDLAAVAPGLEREGLDRALTYVDARVDDARLTAAVAATGAAYGGLVLTRAEPLEGIRGPDGGLRGVVLRDLETGAVHRAEAGLVVNATGVWVDRLRHLLGRQGTRVRPSRGSHLIFPVARLPLRAAVTMLSPDDRRPVFFIPHPEGVVVGTTDLFHEGELDDPRPSPEEIGYLLRTLVAAFPDRGLSLGDAVGAYAGLRPILASDVDDPSRASREEAIWHEDGLLSVAGGKLTTWRVTAEEAVDAALALLPEERSRLAARCATAGTPLAGLAPRDLATRLEARFEVEATVAAGMARRLGSLAWTAAEMARDRSELAPLADGVDLSAAEVRAHLGYGLVLRLSDLLLRRARLGLWTPAVAGELAAGLGPLFRAERGWDAGRWERELEVFGRELSAWTVGGMRAAG